MPKKPLFATKDVGKGTGLGLHIAYNIVKKHHGTIAVESEVGKGTGLGLAKGTTFKIFLPRHAGQAVETSLPETDKIPKSRGETLLAVEDERPRIV